jgi:hypothetical protein
MLFGSRKLTICASALCLLMSGSSSVYAGLLMPDEALRNDLTWLTSRHVLALDLTTWPLSEEAVQESLASLRTENDPATRNALARIDKRIRQLQAPVSAQLWATSQQPRLAPGFQQSQTAAHGLNLGLRSGDEHWELQLQSQLESHRYISDDGRLTLNGSRASVKLFDQWLSFGEIPQWWGPGRASSLIRSDAARPVAGFQLQRASAAAFKTPWLAWLGPWNYQLSAGQLRQYSAPSEPKLFGARLSIMPFSALQIGLSRTLMWGGDGRPQSLSSFGNAIIGRDNTTDASKDPGNQLGGIDFRLNLNPLANMPAAVYGQIIGEDESGFTPSHVMYMAGLEVMHTWDTRQVSWYLEGADTRTGMHKEGISYTHRNYKEGYYQQGYPLGASIGADATQYTFGVNVTLEDGQRFGARLEHAQVNRLSQPINLAWPTADKYTGGELSWHAPVREWLTLDSRLWYSHSEYRHHDVGAGLRAGFTLGALR